MSRLSVENRGSLISINNVPIPKGCSEISVGYQDLSDSDSGRSMNGIMWKGYIGTVRIIKTRWNALTPVNIRKLLQSVKASNGFPVEFYDPESGDYVTSEFYVGDRDASVKQFFKNGELIGLTMNLTEVKPYT